jgi:osmotically-inducible protein OsmY
MIGSFPAIDTANGTQAPSDRAARHDRELEQQLTSRLQDRQVPVHLVEVEAHDGIVTMRGTLRSFYQRQQCIHCGMNLVGVERLIDALEVRYQSIAAE